MNVLGKLEGWREKAGQPLLSKSQGAATSGRAWLREEEVSQSAQALAGVNPRRGALGPCSGGKPRHQGRSWYTCCPQRPAGMLESLVLG